MASVPRSGRWSIEQLLDAFSHLSPAEQREFQRRLAAREEANGSSRADETALIQAAQSRLSPAAERRLRRLIARSERGELTPTELAEYQSLAAEAQRVDVARAEALAELARQRGQAIESLQAEIDPEGPTDGA
jgi:hypothetical protein